MRLQNTKPCNAQQHERMLRLAVAASAAFPPAAATLLAGPPLKSPASAFTPFSYSPLCISRRCQRSTSSRVRTSSWEDKKKQFEERQREQQEEAARAARRRARYASSSTTSSASSASNVKADGAPEDDAAGSSAASSLHASLTKPASGFWAFLKGGSKGRRSQPLNPLMLLQKVGDKSPYDPDARAAQRLIDAVNGLRTRNARRKEPMVVQMPIEQRQEIVNRYVETRWYAPFYRPFQSLTERQIRWSSRIAHFMLFVLTAMFILIVFFAYRKEMETVAKLSPEDRRDYAYMVKGMRYSDIYNTGKAVLDRDDPLEALPPEVRLHMVIEACREKKWHQIDWDVELRKMHPKSAYEERDFIHCLFWIVLDVGRAMVGGGALFSDRVLDVERVRQGLDEPAEAQNRFVELEPTAKPAATKRGFFS